MVESKLVAEFYRHGMHNLDPYWSPDEGPNGGTIDPLDDDDIRQSVRGFAHWLSQYIREAGVAGVPLDGSKSAPYRGSK